MQPVIAAGEFKAKCLQLLDDIAKKRGSLVITKHGKPVARIVPVEPQQPVFGALKGSVIEQHDIVAPINAEWDAAK